MKRLIKKTATTITALSLVTIGFMLSGCGGGGNGLSSQVVSGTASVGAPLAGQVSLKDASATPQVKTTVIGSDGTFAFDVTGMKAPFVLQAKGNAGGSNYTMNSFADGTGTANINPLSDVLVASAAGVDDPAKVYEHPDSDTLQKIKSKLPEAVADLLAKLKPLLKLYSADNEDPIKGHYNADHHGLDGMFDNVSITIANGVVTIVNTKTGAVIFTDNVSDIKNGRFTDGNMPQPPAAPAAPAAPTGVTAVGGAGQVTISWSAVAGATSYNVYYATASGVTTANGTKIANAASPYVQSGLAAGTTYYYIVTAVNSTGEGAASAEASAATNATPAPVPAVPAAPANVMATGGTNQATISWAAVSGATSYNIYWATTSGVTTANGTKLANATSPAVQGGLAAATTYYYIVTAVNSAGESAASAQVAATTLSAVPAPTAPAAPTGVTATGGTQQVTVSWSAVTGATSYNIYWSTTAGVTTANGTKITGATSPYLKTGLLDSTTYYYIVTAVNSAGESAASAQATATTSAPAFNALNYYNTVCLGCHGSLGVRTAAQIQAAITANLGGMGSLGLTTAQIAAIAAVSY